MNIEMLMFLCFYLIFQKLFSHLRRDLSYSVSVKQVNSFMGFTSALLRIDLVL